MAQKPEDFSLPISAISKIVKDAIPEGVRVTDGAKVALSKAASVFVLYATSSANSLSMEANRKRLQVKDVFDALDDLEFDILIPPLHHSLAAYRRCVETKKQAKESKKSPKKDRSSADSSMEMEVTNQQEIITLETDSDSGEEVRVVSISSNSSSDDEP